MNFLLPSSTWSRVPALRRKRGSLVPSSGIETSPPSSTSLILRFCEVSPDGPLNQRLCPAQKTLTIFETLTAQVQAPIDDVHCRFRISTRERF